MNKVKSLNPWIKYRKRWLSKKFNVDIDEPLYILEDGRKILIKNVSSDDDVCIFVEKNWQLCNYDRQEFDYMFYSQKREKNTTINRECVVVCKDHTKFGVFNIKLKKIIVPVKYKQDQIHFEENRICIKIGSSISDAYTYKGFFTNPW